MNDRNGLLAPTLCPERTFALVVGVERYRIGHGWNLPGPASDALRFAAWLTGPGKVPPGNIQLLVSPLDAGRLDWSATPGLTELARSHRSATEANVKDVLLDRFARCDGDLLWIYWAGHGFVDGRQELVLVCSDAHDKETRHLNLDAALRWWRSDRVEWPRFRLQAALVDVCRVDPPRNMKPGSVDYGSDKTVAERRQFRLYACRNGEPAKNDRERESGQFTEVLLDALRDRSSAESVTELDAVARIVQEQFEELRGRDEAWQVPQFIKDRDWNGSSFLDHGMPQLPKAARLDQRAWNGLGEAVGDHALPWHTYDAYAWAFRAAGCITPVEDRLPADSLIEIARDLDERPGRIPDIPLTVPFVRFLAERAEPVDRAWGDGLRAWVEETQERLGVPALPLPPPPHHSTVLHVLLEPAAEETYWVRMLRLRDTLVSVWESGNTPLSLDEMREALGRQLKATQEALRAERTVRGGSVVERVEFHVPFELLDVAFDQWNIPAGRGGRTRPLGLLHQVVVRCPDEREETRAVWEDKWFWLRTQGGRHPKAVRVLKDADLKSAALVPRLRNREAAACLVADLPGSRTTDLLDAALDGGVPAAVWWRGGIPAAEDAAERQELTRLIEPDADDRPTMNVLTLPKRIHDLRLDRADTIGTTGGDHSGPVLLWDDPERTVETRSLHGSPATNPAHSDRP